MADSVQNPRHKLPPQTVDISMALQQKKRTSTLAQVKWEFCGPFISSCKRLLKVLLSAEPRLRRLLAERKRALMKAIEGLGQHGMVGTSDEQGPNSIEKNQLDIMLEKLLEIPF